MRKKRKNKRSKVIPGVLISLCALGAMYTGVSLYCLNHFNFGTVINGINIGGESVEDAKEKISSQMQTYTLELDGRGDVKDQIKATDVGLKYDGDKIDELKKNQNAFAWISTAIKKKSSDASQIVSYDEELLNKTLNNLSCVNDKNVTKPQNASFDYKDGAYDITDEVNGNKINKEALHDSVANAIVNVKPTVNLDSDNCYEVPKYTKDSQETNDAKDLLNKYTSVKITYKSGDKTEVLDGSTIHNWLGVNENMEVTFNEDKVKSYVKQIASMYNTFGSTRSFVTTSKSTVKVVGGNYGWLVDTSKEAKDLIETIKKGQDVTKEPIYSQQAAAHDSNDIGNTYVEVNLTKQHVWFYKNGALVVEGDVVSGCANNNTLTPAGTYILNYKEKNATLKGENYSSPVTYWMPFNGNIGLHDASWRSEFGKQLYITSGSHGCVNCPTELAKAIFENIEPGTPIVCFYE